MTNFLMPWQTFWCHDKLFDITTYVALIDVMTNVLTSWNFLTIWCDFWLFTSLPTFWRQGVFMMAWQTSWCHDVDQFLRAPWAVPLLMLKQHNVHVLYWSDLLWAHYLLPVYNVPCMASLRHSRLHSLRWKLIGTTGGYFVTGFPASSLFVYSGYPAVALFITDQKSTGVGIKMAAAIYTVEAAIFTILK